MHGPLATHSGPTAGPVQRPLIHTVWTGLGTTCLRPRKAPRDLPKQGPLSLPPPATNAFQAYQALGVLSLLGLRVLLCDTGPANAPALCARV